jgi:hypothetical protein
MNDSLTLAKQSLFLRRLFLAGLVSSSVLVTIGTGLLLMREWQNYKSLEAAIQTLTTTESFGGIYLGDSGVPSDEANALAMIMRQRHASSILKGVLDEGQLAGQLYGLCGLYCVDHDGLLNVVEKYRGDTRDVTVLLGCIGMTAHVSEIVEKDIMSGDYPTMFKKFAMMESAN